MSSESPKHQLLQAGRKTRDSLRVIRDLVRQRRKSDIYDETFVKLEDAVDQATDGLIEIASTFEEVLRPGTDDLHPTSDSLIIDLNSLQASLEDMKAEREELIESLRRAQQQLQIYADDLQVLYSQEKMKRLELAQAYERLEEASQLKSDFLSTVNHELTSPLVPLHLSLQLVGKGQLSQQQQQHLAEGQEQLQKYKRQLDGLVKYADLVNQIHVVSKDKLEIEPLLEETLEPLRLLAVGRNVSITIKPIEPGLSIAADRELLSIFFYQITHNAIKFNRPGGSILIEITAKHGGVEFAFSDDGPGISPQVLQRFGQDFNQIVEALRRGEEGLGLGLALANHIANVHNGELSAERRDPKGTTVRLWLPESAE